MGTTVVIHGDEWARMSDRLDKALKALDVETKRRAKWMQRCIRLQEEANHLHSIIANLLREIGEDENSNDNVLFLAYELSKVCGGLPVGYDDSYECPRVDGLSQEGFEWLIERIKTLGG